MMICGIVRKTPRDLSQSRINLGSPWLLLFSWSVSMKEIASSAFILQVWYFSCMINILFILWLDLSLFPFWMIRLWSLQSVQVFYFILTFIYMLINHIFLSFFCPLELRLAFSLLLCNFKQIFSFLKSFALMISFLNLWRTKIEINVLSVYFKNQLTLRS